MGRLGFLFTITGFWLRRMALALRMAACRQGGLRSPPLGACAPHLVFSEHRSCSTVRRGPPLTARLVAPGPRPPRGSSPAHHAQIRAVLVLPDHVPDAAEGGPGVLVDGGPHVGSGRLALAWGGREEGGAPRVSGRVWNVGAHACFEGRIPPRDTECLGRVSAGGCLISHLHLGHIHRDDHRPGPAPIQVSPPYPSLETTLLSSLDKGGLPCVRSHVHSSRLNPIEEGTWHRTGQVVSAPQKAALLLSRPHPPRPKLPQSQQQSPKGGALRPGP